MDYFNLYISYTQQGCDLKKVEECNFKYITIFFNRITSN